MNRLFALGAVALLSLCAVGVAHAAPSLATAMHAAADPDVLAMTLAVAGMGATASPSLQAIEEFSASKATHPRVSLADMEGKILGQHFFTAGDAVEALEQPGHPSLALLTICILVMENGFTVIGKSAPASPENFDADKGRTFAYDDAIKQLWPLEGYALRDRLTQAAA